MIRRTKIVATLGPSTEDKHEILKLVEAGMNIARLNFSHGNYKQFQKIVKNVREVEKERSETLTIMQDLQGPKIRLGEMPEGGFKVSKGDTITFSSKEEKGEIHIPYPMLPKVVKRGQLLLIEDGLIRTKIVSIKDDYVRAKVISGGILKSKKGVNIPDSKLPPSASLTKKDKKDLQFGIETLKVDAIAVSFVEDADDIKRVRREIAKHTKHYVPIIAKIERKEALNNLKEILEEADGVMVARGDLGIETKAERVPVEQKRILNMARSQNKPVIIATQILQSMVDSPLATRAEVSDAANSIFDLADAFMLSNETAVGKYPFKAVRTLARVARATEAAIFRNVELFPAASSGIENFVEDEVIALNAVRVADELDAEAIIVPSKKGFTARVLLKHRPKTPVIVITNSVQTARFLNFLWGVNKIVLHKGTYRSEEIKNFLRDQKLIKSGDDIVLVRLSDKKRSLVVMHVQS